MAKDLRMSLLLGYYGAMLGERTREIAERYYDEDLSLSEIAELFGISRQGVRDHICRADAALTELEEKLGFAARFTEISGFTQKIRSLTGQEDILALCQKISEITD